MGVGSGLPRNTLDDLKEAIPTETRILLEKEYFTHRSTHCVRRHGRLLLDPIFAKQEHHAPLRPPAQTKLRSNIVPDPPLVQERENQSTTLSVGATTLSEDALSERFVLSEIQCLSEGLILPPQALLPLGF